MIPQASASNAIILQATIAPRTQPQDNFSVQVTLPDGRTSGCGAYTLMMAIEGAKAWASRELNAPVYLMMHDEEPRVETTIAARHARLLSQVRAAGFAAYDARRPWDGCDMFVVVRDGEEAIASWDDNDDNLLSLQDATAHAADCNGMLWAKYRAMQPALDFAPATAARRTFASMAAQIDRMSQSRDAARCLACGGEIFNGHCIDGACALYRVSPPPQVAARILPVKVVFGFKEGPINGPLLPVTVETTGADDAGVLERADSYLREWAWVAPATGGYDKTDFTITFADGETYSGRFDLQRQHATQHDLLGGHVREFVTFYAGLRRPAHITEEQYTALLSRENPEEYRAFLARYELGQDATSN